LLQNSAIKKELMLAMNSRRIHHIDRFLLPTILHNKAEVVRSLTFQILKMLHRSLLAITGFQGSN
jgi:hypothetical protein